VYEGFILENISLLVLPLCNSYETKYVDIFRYNCILYIFNSIDPYNENGINFIVLSFFLLFFQYLCYNTGI
jgi:hypothetical protein